MYQLYKMHLKCLVKDTQNMFWSLCFPIILATLFNAAFSNLNPSASFDTVPIAVVSESGNTVEESFIKTLEESRISDNHKLFKVTVCDEGQAADMLKDGDISGYILAGDSLKLIVKSSGINETIIKTFLDSYKQTQNTVNTIIKMEPEVAVDQLLADLGSGTSYLEDQTDKNNNPNPIVVYFYALIAMTCLIGSHWGNKVITDIQADLSPKGARIHVAPVHKMKLLICNLLAAFTVQIFNISVLMFYLYSILKIDFGDSLYYICLTCFIGSSTGIMLGALITAIVKQNENIKQSLLTLVSIGGSALAGLMVIDIKYIVDTQMPFIAFINPASLITDALYRLYYYGADQRYFINISILAVMTVGFTFITYWSTRREEYASL